MDAELVSLFCIVAIAAIAPAITTLIPNRLIPETVLLLAAGMIIGPNVLDIAQADNAIQLLSDLGLGFLFLLAGYEINPQQLTGGQGRHGLITWLVTFAIAIAICITLPSFHENEFAFLATAIALTTTAFGTLVPILHERGLMGTPIGKAIFAYGTWGELCPIIVIALILSTRQTWVTLAILGAFALIAVACALIPRRIFEKGIHLPKFVNSNRDTNAQIIIRLVMVLLVGLVTVSALFDLDIVLGAFAAGFVLRFIIPNGDEGLEHKLNGIGFGFFVPLFFVVSGMAINPMAVAKYPLLLVLFIVALLAVRALPVFFGLRIAPETRAMDRHARATVALYCTTALPLIVAITNIATGADAMSPDIASLLVAAGGITVLLMPLLASVAFGRITNKSHANACPVEEDADGRHDG